MTDHHQDPSRNAAIESSRHAAQRVTAESDAEKVLTESKAGGPQIGLL